MHQHIKFKAVALDFTAKSPTFTYHVFTYDKIQACLHEIIFEILSHRVMKLGRRI